MTSPALAFSPLTEPDTIFLQPQLQQPVPPTPSAIDKLAHDFNRGCYLLSTASAPAQSHSELNSLAANLQRRPDWLNSLTATPAQKAAIAAYYPFKEDLDGPSAQQLAANATVRAAVIETLADIAKLGATVIKQSAVELRNLGAFDAVFRAEFARDLEMGPAARGLALEYGMPNVDARGVRMEASVREIAHQRGNAPDVLAIPLALPHGVKQERRCANLEICKMM